MNIALKPEQEQFIKSQIDKGRLKSADEAVFQAFKLLEEKYRDYENWIEETRDKVEVAIAELDRGEGIDLDIAMEQLKHKFKSAQDSVE